MYIVQIIGVGLLGKPGYDYPGIKTLREYVGGLRTAKMLWERGGYLFPETGPEGLQMLVALNRGGVHFRTVSRRAITFSVNVGCPLNKRNPLECTACPSHQSGKCVPNGVHNEPNPEDKITPQEIHEIIYGESPQDIHDIIFGESPEEIHDIVFGESPEEELSGCAIVRRTRKSSPLCGSESYCRGCTYEVPKQTICIGCQFDVPNYTLEELRSRNEQFTHHVREILKATSLEDAAVTLCALKALVVPDEVQK
jgi:hypothetical protein